MSAFQPSLFRPDGGQGNSLQPLPLLAMNRSVRAAYADDHGAEPMPRDDRPEGPVFAYIELDMLCMHPCEIKTYLTLQAGESLAGKPARDGNDPAGRIGRARRMSLHPVDASPDGEGFAGCRSGFVGVCPFLSGTARGTARLADPGSGQEGQSFTAGFVQSAGRAQENRT